MARSSLTLDPLGSLVAKLARVHCELWREEERARSDDENVVAAATEAIDRLDRRRRDVIERIDRLVANLTPERGSSGD